MAEVTMPQAAAADEPEILAQLAKWSGEIGRLLQEMKQDQIEIDRLHESNLARLSNIEKVLARIASN